MIITAPTVLNALKINHWLDSYVFTSTLTMLAFFNKKEITNLLATDPDTLFDFF